MPEPFSTPRNTIEFRVWGRYAMFTDPLTRVGGEKCSYHLPTYEAIKGICKSIYWKPTFIWYIDQLRVLRRIRTQTKSMKPIDYNGSMNPSRSYLSPTLSLYTYLTGDVRPGNADQAGERPNEPTVEYQVRAHFEWNPHQPALRNDRIDGKHFAIAKRSLERGGRQDIFLGTRDCQGYVEPCVFGSGPGDYDSDGELQYGLMFHSFDYPDETGNGRLATNFWRPKLTDGILTFPRPDDAQIIKKDIRPMNQRRFGDNPDLLSVEAEFELLETSTGPLETEPGVQQ